MTLAGSLGTSVGKKTCDGVDLHEKAVKMGAFCFHKRLPLIIC